MLLLGFVASLIMGITLGLMGGGGSILTVPIMVYLFGVNPSLATGYSLFVVGTTALIGSTLYLRKGEFNFKTGLLFALPSVIGVNISRALIIPTIPATILTLNNISLTKEVLIMATFATLMITASYSMIKKNSAYQASNTNVLMRSLLLALQGLFVGLIAGFVGAGGGFLIIPALVLLAGLTMRIAVGTSLMIIATQSLLGFAGDIWRGTVVDWSLLLKVAGIAIIGIILGSTLASKIKEQDLKKTFGWFVLLMGLSILAEQLHKILN